MQELHRTRGNGDTILECFTKTFMCTGCQVRVEALLESGLELIAVLTESPGKTGGHCGSLFGKDVGGNSLRSIHQCVSLEVALSGESGPAHQC